MPKSLKKLSSRNESFVRVSFGIYLEAVPTLSLRCQDIVLTTTQTSTNKGQV
jgi:hypothetical protein